VLSEPALAQLDQIAAWTDRLVLSSFFRTFDFG
jgi:hypothetical protein